jgi:GTPase SAR1 family protein
MALAAHEIRLNFFDLAGEPEYKTIRQEFYEDAQGALLVYNPAKRESFVALQHWLQEAQANGATNMVCLHLMRLDDCWCLSRSADPGAMARYSMI